MPCYLDGVNFQSASSPLDMDHIFFNVSAGICGTREALLGLYLPQIEHLALTPTPRRWAYLLLTIEPCCKDPPDEESADQVDEEYGYPGA